MIASLMLLMIQSCSGSLRQQPVTGITNVHLSDEHPENIIDIKNLPDTVSKEQHATPLLVDKQLIKDTTIYQKQMEFVRYNDDGDYFLLIAKDDTGVEYFINNDIVERNLNRGDLIQLELKNGIITISGDGETPEAAVFVLFANKIEDGGISRFRKSYPKDLMYIPGVEYVDYTDYYIKKIEQDLEYYLVNTSNRDLLKAFLVLRISPTL